MKLSQLIREYIDLKIEGEPPGSDWSSTDSNSTRVNYYRSTLQELEDAIDEAVTVKGVDALPVQPKLDDCPNIRQCEGQCFQCEYYNAESGKLEYPSIEQPTAQRVAVPLTANQLYASHDLMALNSKHAMSMTEIVEITRVIEAIIAQSSY